MNIVVHTRDGCPWCDMAKDWLAENNFEFKVVEHNDVTERQAFYESCGKGVRTVPQIFVDDKRIGGYSELMECKDELLISKNGFDAEF